MTNALPDAYDMSGNGPPTIDGQEVPWPIAVNGPRIEPVNEWTHILWLPILVKGACPAHGAPDAHPLNPTQKQAWDLGWDAHEAFMEGGNDE